MSPRVQCFLTHTLLFPQQEPNIDRLNVLNKQIFEAENCIHNSQKKQVQQLGCNRENKHRIFDLENKEADSDCTEQLMDADGDLARFPDRLAFGNGSGNLTSGNRPPQ